MTCVVFTCGTFSRETVDVVWVFSDSSAVTVEWLKCKQTVVELLARYVIAAILRTHIVQHESPVTSVHLFEMTGHHHTATGMYNC